MLEVHHISKEFPGVKALDKVHLVFEPGKVHALLGENGAGKSTLLKILSGIYLDYSGEIKINGKTEKFSGVKDSEKAGIAIIHQELNLFPNLTIEENIFLGKEITHSFGLLQKAKMREITQDLLQQLGLAKNPDTLVSELKISEQQLVEIAKALHSKAEIILMDEPTSALSDKEIDQLHLLIKEWRNQGKTIVYISHKMDELFKIADHYAVLRDGKSISSGKINETNHQELIEMMVGRKVIIQKKESTQHSNLDTLKIPGYFNLKQGEILGIFGLMGAGRTELLEQIFGINPFPFSIEILGEKKSIKNPIQAINAGIGFLTEDRKTEGLILEENLSFNLGLINTRLVEPINFKEEEKLSESYIKELKIKTPSAKELCLNLSGGNQQKVILAKWLSKNPTILLLDEPTRGIDIQAKSEIYEIIKKLAESGKSILLVSSEIPEILALSDRILVMSEGNITAEYSSSEANENLLLKSALPQL